MAPKPLSTATSRGSGTHHWTFLTNHSHVLICLLQDPGARLRDVAQRVRITERAVQNIVRDLVAAGVIARRRDGRRNLYAFNLDRSLRHPVEAHCTVEKLMQLMLAGVQVGALGDQPSHPSDTADEPGPHRDQRAAGQMNYSGMRWKSRCLK